ncbi:MAG TPA: hypothetical protein VG867_06195, partial [Rhizomicrobium sp.]|nr:hypothetical protein [Rhizomicrobium sp.]
MERLSGVVYVGSAACFCLVVIFLISEMVGFGQPALIWELSFIDYVNAAPAVIGVFGAALIIQNIDDLALPLLKIRSRSDEWLFITISLCSLSYVAWVWHHGVVALDEVIFLVTLAVLAPAVPMLIARSFPNFWNAIEGRALRLFWLCATVIAGFGFLIGSSQNSTDSHFILVTPRCELRSQVELSISRGAAIANSTGYMIVPWQQVIALQKSAGPEWGEFNYID